MADLRREMVEQFGPYRVVEKLAGGGMAEIFKVFHESEPTRPLALKRIRPDRSDDVDFKKMLMDEAKIACRLKHKNIARVLDLHRVEGVLGLILEYVDGVDLVRAQGVHRDRGSAFSLDVAIHLIREVLAGLHFAHTVKDKSGELLHVVHRDVSPGNVMIDLEGNVRIVDWGIARAKNRVAHTEAGNVKGKFRYMAPEQITGQMVGPYSDVYSAAVTFWEILAGNRIYDDEELPQLMMRVSKGDLPPLEVARPDVPKALVAVFKKATVRDPAKRYPTAKAFSDALAELPVRLTADQAQSELKNIPIWARLDDSRRSYERALKEVRGVSAGDLEGALLRALEEPDRVDPIDVERSAIPLAERSKKNGSTSFRETV